MKNHSMWTRRQLLVGAGVGLVSYLVSQFIARAPIARAVRRSADGPRYWIGIVPFGGIDAVYTTDPRTRADVAAGVDVPYAPEAIVDAGGGVVLGPAFRDLAPWISKLAVLNGVLVNTANHHTGLTQVAQLRTRTSDKAASAFEIIGAHRDGQAVGYLSLGAWLYSAYTPSYLGEPTPTAYGPPESSLFTLIDKRSPESLALMGRVMGEHAASLRRRGPGSDRDEAVRSAMEQASSFFHRIATAPRFHAEAWLAPGAPGADALAPFATHFQRALWAIENDLAATIGVFSKSVWDSHVNNAKTQEPRCAGLAILLDRFFRELEQRENAHGRLSEQTAVVMTSEIGRFPYLNQAAGKDHYPQACPIFYGAPFRRGARFGDTGKELESLPISLATGRAEGKTGGGDRRRVELDDVGTTVLGVAGLEPAKHGFAGRRLDFLLEE